jgi:hypothetical protein
LTEPQRTKMYLNLREMQKSTGNLRKSVAIVRFRKLASMYICIYIELHYLPD